MIYLTNAKKIVFLLFFFLFSILNVGDLQASEMLLALANDLPNNLDKDWDGGAKKGQPLLTPGKKGVEQLGNVQGDVKKGKIIYTAKCVYCHGKKGLGNGMAAMALEPKPANYRALKTYLKTDQQLFETVTYGRKGSYQLDMPAWGPVMTKQERADVLFYVKKLAKPGKDDSKK